MHSEDTGALEIRQYLALLRRWFWLIALAALLAAGAAFVAGKLSTPIYEASSTLLISGGQKATGPDYNALLMSERLAKTYAQMMKGQPVLDEVAARLGLPSSAEGLQALAGAVMVEPVCDTQLIRVRASHADAALAAEIANTVPTVFIDYNTQAQAARFAASLESLDAEMQRLLGEIEATQYELDELKAGSDPDGKQVQLETLLAQYRATYAGLLSNYEEIRSAQAREMDSLAVFEPATVPYVPALPRTRTNTLLAAVVGAMLAVGAALLIEYLDDTVKLPEDVQRVVGLSTLALVGRHEEDELDRQRPLMTVAPNSAVAEAYRMLRANVEFSTIGLRDAGIALLVTSAQPGEGKTTTLANLGVALAQVGKRVLLVDADLRRGALHKHFGLRNGSGLTTLYLRPDADPERVIKETGVEGLRLLTSGPLPSNSAEILGFPQTDALLKRLRPLADYILLDAPPLLSVADASVLAQRVDAVLLVAEAGRARSEVLWRAAEALRAVQARVLGVVLNKLERRAGDYHGYYTEYHRTSEQDRRKGRLAPGGWRRSLMPAARSVRYALRGLLALLGVAVALLAVLGMLSRSLDGANGPMPTRPLVASGHDATPAVLVPLAEPAREVALSPLHTPAPTATTSHAER